MMMTTWEVARQMWPEVEQPGRGCAGAEPGKDCSGQVWAPASVLPAPQRTHQWATGRKDGTTLPREGHPPLTSRLDE